MLSFRPISGSIPIAPRRTLGDPEDEARTAVEEAVRALADETLRRARALMSDVEASERLRAETPWSLLDASVIRGQIVDVSVKLSTFVDEALAPPLAPYVTPRAAAAFVEARRAALDAGERAESLGTAPLPAGAEPLADDYAVSVLEELKGMRDNAHRMVVAIEGVEGPREPSETAQASGVLVAIGVLAVVGFAFWASSGKA